MASSSYYNREAIDEIRAAIADRRLDIGESEEGLYLCATRTIFPGYCQLMKQFYRPTECHCLQKLGEDKKKMVTPQILFVLRLLLTRGLKMNEETSIYSTRNSELLECLPRHPNCYLNLDECAQMAKIIDFILGDVLNINSKEIAEIILKLPGNVLSISHNKTQYGWGLYPLISLGTHSCYPNAEVLFMDGRRIVHLISTDYIYKGSKILIDYNNIVAEPGVNLAHPINCFMCSCSECHPPGIEFFSGLQFAVSQLGKVSRRYFGSFVSKEKPA